MALRALTTVTRYGGEEVRCLIAKHTDSLTRLVDALPDDPVVCDLTVSIMAHCVVVITDGTEDLPKHPETLRKLDMGNILQTAMHCITEQFSPSSVEHGRLLLASTTLHINATHWAVKETEQFLIAGLRSEDWGILSVALGGLMRLYKPGSEEELRHLDPQVILSAVQRPPNILKATMAAYGPRKCDIFLTLVASRDVQSAMIEAVQDHNIYALGMKRYKIILSTEFSIYDGYFLETDPRTGQDRIMDTGLPFERYIDALPICAKAIREKGVAEEQDAVNVLELKLRSCEANLTKRWCSRKKLSSATRTSPITTMPSLPLPTMSKACAQRRRG